ncbi:MAG: Uma2 family endonuclease [Bacteroidia bacterium]
MEKEVMAAVKEIPKTLIYEMINGHPVYYRGYKDYLKGNVQLEEVMGSSKLQAFLAVELIFWLKTHLKSAYYIFTNELGLQFEKNSWRSADIAVISKQKMPHLSLDEKYLESAPELVIEIDTKADLSEVQNPLGYYQEKTQDLINFGVEKVIWIFTDTQKVMIAEPGKRWEIADWSEDIQVIDSHMLNLRDLISGMVDFSG